MPVHKIPLLDHINMLLKKREVYEADINLLKQRLATAGHFVYDFLRDFQHHSSKLLYHFI